MRKQRNQKKAQVTVWIFALVFLFMTALIYIIMTKPYILVRDKFVDNFTGTEFEETFTRLNTFWRIWPILVLLGVFLWAVLSTIKQNPQFPQL